MQWSIDCSDAFSVARVRHAVIDELRTLTTEGDVFPVEVVLGEVLAAEMERGGHAALVVTVDRGLTGPNVHLYMQGRPAIACTQGELRAALLRETHVPIAIEVSAQGTHMCLRVPAPAEARPSPEFWDTSRSVSRVRMQSLKDRLRSI